MTDSSGGTDQGEAPVPPSKPNSTWSEFLLEVNRLIADFNSFRKQAAVLIWADALSDVMRRLLHAANLLYANSDRLQDQEFRTQRQRAVSSLARLVYLAKLASFAFPPSSVEHRVRRQALHLAQHVQTLVAMLETQNVELGTPGESQAIQFPDYTQLCKPLPAPTSKRTSGSSDSSRRPLSGDEWSVAVLIRQVLPFKNSFVYLDGDDIVHILEHLSAHIIRTVASSLNNLMKEVPTGLTLSHCADILRTLGWTGQVLCLAEALVDTSDNPHYATSESLEKTGCGIRPQLPQQFVTGDGRITAPLLAEKQRLYDAFNQLLQTTEANYPHTSSGTSQELMTAVMELLKASEEMFLALKTALQDKDVAKYLSVCFQWQVAHSHSLRHTPLVAMKRQLNQFYHAHLRVADSTVGIAKVPDSHLDPANTGGNGSGISRRTTTSGIDDSLVEVEPSSSQSFLSPLAIGSLSIQSSAGNAPTSSLIPSPLTITTTTDATGMSTLSTTPTYPLADATALTPISNRVSSAHSSFSEEVGPITRSRKPSTTSVTLGSIPERQKSSHLPGSGESLIDEEPPEKRTGFAAFALPFMRRIRSRPDLIADSHHKRRVDFAAMHSASVLPSPDSPLHPPDSPWSLKNYTAGSNLLAGDMSTLPPPTLPEAHRVASEEGTTITQPPMHEGIRVQRQRSLDALTVLSHAPRSTRALSESHSEYMAQRPWYMQYDHVGDEIKINDQGQIMSATMEALVERLTLHDSLVDSEYISTFLLTFRSFCTPTRFLELVVARFHLPEPQGLTEGEVQRWQQQKLIPARLRVVNLVKTWLESYFFDDEDEECLDPLLQFVTGPLHRCMPAPASRLRQLVTAKQQALATADGSLPARLSKSKNIDRLLAAAYASLPDTPPPSPRLPRSILLSLLDRLPVSLYDIDPVEVARQLTIMDGRLFGAIRPHELIGQEFSKKDESTATNVRAMSARSTRITAWVVVSILSESDLKRRAAALKYFLKVADHLLCLNNLNTLIAVACGLSYSAITRLNLTWKQLAVKYSTLIKSLNQLTDTDRNFAMYRSRLRNQKPPCLPFLGVYLTDLTFTDDGNRTYCRPNDPAGAGSGKEDTPSMSSSSPRITPTGSERGSVTSISTPVSGPLINFYKYTITVRIIKEIQKFQVPYNLRDVPELQRYLMDDFERTYTRWDEPALHQLSLQLEPRKGSVMGPPAIGAPTQATSHAGTILKSANLFSHTSGPSAAGSASQSSLPTLNHLAAGNEGFPRSQYELPRSKSSFALQDIARRGSENQSPLSTEGTSTSGASMFFSSLKRTSGNGPTGSSSVISSRGLAFGFT
ncbi:hypothetical protein IWQ61_004985 [Dispira simplex]|nr:hypothetical protein IWQ61_004985 [Dispira simplex]